MNLTRENRILRLQDRAYERVFSLLLVYTILFEDNERDLEFLALGEGDHVFMVAGAGCGVAACLAAAPARVDVVDFNRKHLAVTALKVNAARAMRSYDEFHELLARGRHPRPREVVGRLARDLPPKCAAFWKTGWRMFRRDFYAHGLCGRNLDFARRFWSISPEYLKTLNAQPEEERAEEIAALLARRIKRGAIAALIRSPLGILAAGINYTQRARNLRAVGTDDAVEGVIDYASRVVRTDLERNWIVWHIVTGQFNHERPECLPLYLRPDFHERSVGSPTEVRYWHNRLLAQLGAADDETWSRYCLSDVVDWMGDPAREALFREVHRTAKPGARVICRTVEDSTIVDELGFAERFRLVEPHSTLASQEERSCLYRRVNCYEVVK
jgi:S-adenosylmethionine-diacylglycerol 3-amino-3-carboxypropyl transferase